MDITKYYAQEGEKPLDNIVQDGGFCKIFRTIGCIGDSLSSGEFENVSDEDVPGYHDYYEYSFGHYMAIEIVSKVYNFSKGGMTTAEFYENFAKQNGFLSEDLACQAYIIALGVNDLFSQGMEVGSIDDFILSAGITANYKLSRNCFLLLNVNYIQPLGRFTYRKYVTDLYTGEKVERGVYKSSTFARDLNVSVGFGFPFYLGRKTNRKSPHRERTRQLMEQKRKTYGLFPGNK